MRETLLGVGLAVCYTGQRVRMNFLRPPASRDSDGTKDLVLRGTEPGLVLSTCTDEELVCIYQAGEKAAFEMLVERYQDSTYNYILNSVREEETAGDLTQEAFVRAFLKLPVFRGQSLFRTWLYRIARNLCVDNYRRQKKERKRRTYLGANEDGWEDSPGIVVRDERQKDALDGLISEETRREVRMALEMLPEKMRSALILYDLEGMSCEEIARIVGCPVGTVKSRLFNGRLRLREILRPYIDGG